MPRPGADRPAERGSEQHHALALLRREPQMLQQPQELPRVQLKPCGRGRGRAVALQPRVLPPMNGKTIAPVESLVVKHR